MMFRIRSARRTRASAGSLRPHRAALAAVSAMVLAGAVAAPSHAALRGVFPVDPATGFPHAYQDTDGLSLELCLGPPACLVAAGDLRPPDGEAFYFNAQADVAIPGGGDAQLVIAQEAAFLGNDPITFGRIRVNVVGAAASTTYTFQHPYGTASLTTNAQGTGRFNSDVGCGAAPCDFGAALGTAIGPFLTWDASVSPPPAGTIGDALTPHPVVGSPSNFNRFQVTGPAGTATQTDFILQGRLAGPPVPVFNGPAALDFGAQAVGGSAAQLATVRSFGVPDPAQGLSRLLIAGIGVSGPAAADYHVVATDCGATVVLPSGTQCSVNVVFAPTAPGPRPATLDFTTNALGSLRQIALAGTGVAAAVAGRARSNLRLRRVRTTHRVSRSAVRSRGLVFRMRVPRGTRVLRVAVYRVRNGRKARRATYVTFRKVRRAGPFTLALRSRTARRRLTVGLYQFNLTPGQSRQRLGRTFATRIRITP